MLKRTKLLLAESEIAKTRMFYGRHRVPSRDILNVPRDRPTSEGVKKDRFGTPWGSERIRYVRNWDTGEEQTEKKRPENPENKGYKKRGVADSLFTILPRQSLLVDALDSV